MIYALITSEENMGRLDRYKEISKKLALAKGLTDEEAHRLAAEGKAVVIIGNGMHATECAPAQGAIQLAYELVTSEEPDTRLILANTIILLFYPNPDGMTMLAEWYLPNVGTPYEVSAMPWLYNKYVGHDINLDSYMNNLKEVQNITRVVNQEWFPVILYDHHQTAPFPARIWIPPAAEPTNANLHPLFIRGKNLDMTRYPTLWQGIVRPQSFTDAYLPPYDMAGWTLPYQMGVKVAAANTPLKVGLEPLHKVVPTGGKVQGGAGYGYLISPKTNNSFIALNRILKKGGQVLWAQDSFSFGGKEYPAGTLIVSSNSVSERFMESLAKELYLDMGAAASQPSVKTYKLNSPRVALYRSYVASMDEGWTRWLFEQYEFPFTNVYDGEVRAGDLGKRFDVLVIPSSSTEAIVNGHREGTIPPQYAGGITETGVRNIREFVEGGGALVTLKDGCLFALDKLGIPVSDALKSVRIVGRRSADEVTRAQAVKFACPGSLLRMEFDAKHPVAYGMPAEAPGMFYGGTAFEVSSSDEKPGPTIIAKYPGRNLLMSGYLQGENFLQNKAAAVDVPVGKGRVVLLGFGVQNRAQPHGTFKLLFNSLLYGVAQ